MTTETASDQDRPFVSLGLSYKDAREIVTSPLYRPIRAKGSPMHPNDAWRFYSGPKDGWGASLAKHRWYEKTLIDYIYHYFGCVPERGEREHYINMEYKKQNRSK